MHHIFHWHDTDMISGDPTWSGPHWLDRPPFHLCPSLPWQWRLWHPHLGCYGRATPSQVDLHISFLATFLFGRVRATANAIVICMGFILGFVMSKTFVDLINAIHARYSSYLNLKVSICNSKFSHIDKYFGWKFPMTAAPSGCMGECASWAPSTQSSLSPRRRGRRLKRSSKCFPPVRKRGG